MELAKISSKGQITLPARIRRVLNLDFGGKVAFIEKDGQFFVINPATMIAFGSSPQTPEQPSSPPLTAQTGAQRQTEESGSRDVTQRASYEISPKSPPRKISRQNPLRRISRNGSPHRS